MKLSKKTAVIGALVAAQIASIDMVVFAQTTETTQSTQTYSTGEYRGKQPLGVVSSGNSTAFFMPANEKDLDVEKLRRWQAFSDEHPDIAHTIAYNPKVLTDDTYIQRHPDLASFFADHPEIKEAMIENPGNYEAIPPRPGE